MKRYDNHGMDGLFEEADGNYVEWADVEKLQDANDKLWDDIKRLQDEYLEAVHDNAIRHENERNQLRMANCDNCKWSVDDGFTCSNPVDQCGKGDRMMWGAK